MDIPCEEDLINVLAVPNDTSKGPASKSQITVNI